MQHTLEVQTDILRLLALGTFCGTIGCFVEVVMELDAAVHLHDWRTHPGRVIGHCGRNLAVYALLPQSIESPQSTYFLWRGATSQARPSIQTAISS